MSLSCVVICFLLLLSIKILLVFFYTEMYEKNFLKKYKEKKWNKMTAVFLHSFQLPNCFVCFILIRDASKCLLFLLFYWGFFACFCFFLIFWRSLAENILNCLLSKELAYIFLFMLIFISVYTSILNNTFFSLKNSYIWGWRKKHFNS